MTWQALSISLYVTVDSLANLPTTWEEATDLRGQWHMSYGLWPWQASVSKSLVGPGRALLATSQDAIHLRNERLNACRWSDVASNFCLPCHRMPLT